jgi:hypothetical protein
MSGHVPRWYQWRLRAAHRIACSLGVPGAQSVPFKGSGLRVMHYALWGYLIAIAAGCMSLFVRKDAFPNVPWLSFSLLLLAFLIAFLASLGFARDKGWLSRVAPLLRPSRLRSPLVRREIMSSDNNLPGQVAPAVHAPRPAGPAGPVPVLEKRPRDTTDDVIVTTGTPGVVNRKSSTE